MKSTRSGAIAAIAAIAERAAVPIVAVLLSAAPLASWLREALASAGLEELRWSLLVLTHAFSGTLRITVGTTTFLALLLFPLGALARMIARARVRSGLPDPLAGIRAWATSRARTVEAIFVAIIVAWTALLARRFQSGDLLGLGSAHLLASLIGGWAQLIVMRAGLGALVSPTLGGGARGESGLKARPGITYDAVARTGEARAAIGLVFALSIVMFGLVAALPTTVLMHDRRVFAAVGGYVLVVLAAAFGFRSASRAAIGIDGVRVYGTSRTRFVGYRELDEVRTNGAALELVREQLWTVVESAAGDAKTRLTAIEALARTGGERDRERLRVAFEQCAEPSLRVAARDLDAMGHEVEEEKPTRDRMALRR